VRMHVCMCACAFERVCMCVCAFVWVSECAAVRVCHGCVVRACAFVER